jgi:hypothetical protein
VKSKEVSIYNECLLNLSFLLFYLFEDQNILNINIRRFAVVKHTIKVAVVIAMLVNRANPKITMYDHILLDLICVLRKKNVN